MIAQDQGAESTVRVYIEFKNGKENGNSRSKPKLARKLVLKRLKKDSDIS